MKTEVQTFLGQTLILTKDGLVEAETNCRAAYARGKCGCALNYKGCPFKVCSNCAAPIYDTGRAIAQVPSGLGCPYCGGDDIPF